MNGKKELRSKQKAGGCLCILRTVEPCLGDVDYDAGAAEFVA
jgi:hypothetical protein